MLETVTALVSAASSIVGLTKGAAEAAQDIKALVDKPDVDPAAAKQLASDLLDRLIRLQTEQVAMQGAILDFRDEQRRIDRFQAEAVRYALTQTDRGALLYQLKASHANGEPVHCICATCYQQQIKSILQPSGYNVLGCPTCRTQFEKSDGRSLGASTGYSSPRDKYRGY